MDDFEKWLLSEAQAFEQRMLDAAAKLPQQPSPVQTAADNVRKYLDGNQEMRARLGRPAAPG